MSHTLPARGWPVRAAASAALFLWAGATLAQVGFSEMERAPEAANWAERDQRLERAALIEIDLEVQGDRDQHAASAQVRLLHTPMGTVACVRQGARSCAGLASVGLNLAADDLLALVVGQVDAGRSGRALPGSSTVWPLPADGRAGEQRASLSDWSFNPEAGMPMPGQIDIATGRGTKRLSVSRFVLIRATEPAK